MGSFGDSGRLRTDEITPETPDALIMWGNFVCPESPGKTIVKTGLPGIPPVSLGVEGTDEITTIRRTTLRRFGEKNGAEKNGEKNGTSMIGTSQGETEIPLDPTE
jgi:hypothetical protein